MTVQELIDELSEMNPESEVRWAAQPAWPFEYSISSVENFCRETEDNEDANDDPNDPRWERYADPMADDIVYLVEGTQLGYLPGAVCRQIGWKG